MATTKAKTRLTKGPHYEVDATTFFTARRRSREERHAAGVAAREQVPLANLAEVPARDGRPDPIGILRSQESDREPALVPIRYERMSVDPFAFLRGAAAIMASDLSRVASSGVSVQLCGDAHIANFGMFASAERTLVFDVNDFDETLPGSFDWDVRRLATSVAVAARNRGMSDKKARKAARAAARSYRKVMAQLSTMRRLDLWNLKIDTDVLTAALHNADLRKATVKATDKSRRATGDAALVKLTETVDGKRRFRNQPPLLTPVPEDRRKEVIDTLAPMYDRYLHTLPPDRVALLAHYSFVDLAHKVVGVGSVGTRALVMLLESGDGEPLLLQVKQADASVLEPYLGASVFDNHAKRVVVGQRVMQATGDPFLGWLDGAEGHHDYYVRQLKDMKGAIDTTLLDEQALEDYARVCGAALARAHARVGDAFMVTGYVGDTTGFDEAVADFALGYADITDADHHALVTERV